MAMCGTQSYVKVFEKSTYSTNNLLAPIFFFYYVGRESSPTLVPVFSALKDVQNFDTDGRTTIVDQ